MDAAQRLSVEEDGVNQLMNTTALSQASCSWSNTHLPQGKLMIVQVVVVVLVYVTKSKEPVWEESMQRGGKEIEIHENWTKDQKSGAVSFAK